MNRFMTIVTYRYNIKPIFRGVTQIVMVLLRRFIAKSTQKRRNTRQFTRTNSTTNRFASFNFILISLAVFSTSYAKVFRMFLTMPPIMLIPIMSAFVFFGIYLETFFTPSSIAVFSVRLFIKFRNRFNLLAFRTLLCLNCLSHSLISDIKLWSEPVSGYNPFLARFILTHRGSMSRLNP